MECPYCHKEIPQDSAFCYHCGKELNGEKKEIKESKKLKKNPRENSFAKLDRKSTRLNSSHAR